MATTPKEKRHLYKMPPKLGKWRIPRTVQRVLIGRRVNILELARLIEKSYGAAWFRWYGRARWQPTDSEALSRNLGVPLEELTEDPCFCDGTWAYCRDCSNLLLEAQLLRSPFEPSELE